jgi:hypothetical protein
MLAIDRIGMPPALVAALKHLASLHNPEYYEKERLRFSTWNRGCPDRRGFWVTAPSS